MQRVSTKHQAPLIANLKVNGFKKLTHEELNLLLESWEGLGISYSYYGIVRDGKWFNEFFCCNNDDSFGFGDMEIDANTITDFNTSDISSIYFDTYALFPGEEHCGQLFIILKDGSYITMDSEETREGELG